MSARSEYLRKLLDDGRSYAGLNETILAQMYEYADGLGLSPGCQAKADATDPLRTLEAREGEEDSILARMSALTEEKSATMADVNEMLMLATRLRAIRSE